MKVVVPSSQASRNSKIRVGPQRRFRAAFSTLDRRPSASEEGVALVITLIMLSVITFMAIAFLVLSRGERSSVGTATDQSIARLGAENALERAQVELLAPMLASGNVYSSGLLVSTNFINPNGFQIGPGRASPTNVAYTYSTGAPLRLQDSLQNLTNLLINPRPPVFIVTNRLTAASDFRYYLDLNRNGVFDLTGLTGITNSAGGPVTDSKNNRLIDFVQGDPQWIGALEFPDRNHSPDNRFLYRYAYIAVPTSQTLDVNYIHNYAKGTDVALRPGAGDGFLRNQGIGTWEINLGAFLADLNTNVWATNTAPYAYYADPVNYSRANTGIAFDDALSVLRYRYFANLTTVPSVQSLFGAIGTRAVSTDFIDDYSAGPPMTATYWSGRDYDNSRFTRSWAGSDSTNHIFSTQDFFDPTKVGQTFVNHLIQASSDTNNTYNRTTFYRLLSQLGTDSAPEAPGKINLNYDNLVQTNARGIISATNFFAWRPIDFFTNAANMLLTNSGFLLSVTNLQVYPTNFYTPSVHRTLQLAANIYDASTNRALVAGQQNGFPSVFRPIFRRINTGSNNVVVIAGYREVLDAQFADSRTAPTIVDLTVSNPNAAQFLPYGTPAVGGAEKNELMVAGVPLIVGAKKGYPNFNELAMETQIFVSRLLEFRRAAGDPNTQPVNETNQMYVIGITNLMGLEAWNSYLTTYSNDLQLVTSVSMAAVMTNELSATIPIYTIRTNEGRVMNIPRGTWKGWTTAGNAPYSFVVPLTNTLLYLTNSTYSPGQVPLFPPVTHVFRRNQGFYVPHWWLNLNTRVQFVLVDKSVVPNRIIDYVNLNNWEQPVDITYELARNNTSPVNPADYRNPANQWLTNRLGNSPSIFAPTLGIINQIQIGENGNNGDWLSFSQDPYAGLDANKAVDGFRYNLGLSPMFDPAGTFFKSNIFYAPFDPVRTIYVHTSWQANDPLVHYTIGDLVDSITFDPTNRVNTIPLGIKNIGQINHRYRPWGGNPNNADPLTDTQFAIKDPFVTRSDDWDFPTNKFPNIGWLGRVHRGTPWQTVFLKSTNYLQMVAGPQGFAASLRNWAIWTGNPVLLANPALSNMVTATLVGTNSNNNNFSVSDSIFTSPTNDWHILDLFTTAINDNATRGQLSINQTNLAAWSAVLSGVSVLPNAISTNGTFILPAGVDPVPRLATIVNGINNARTNFPNKAFARLGDILATPELTVASPYIVSTNRAQIINDEVMERIPQQILGLLHGGEQPPRYVIYSYGQALKPAPKSLYMGGGPYFGLCTNYQITAEVATRAVVRIEGAPNKPRTVIESFSVLPPD
ncbi:MAG TPA: hypothetical protein VL793_04025 [Patescibacteria group bacterium]|nr:hypothetical protein [Patescibacteria group bacterium]